MNDGYRFELTNVQDAGERAQIAALLRRVFPKARHLTERYLAWLYAANPDGEAVGCNAWAGNALVGHMAATAMTGRVAGEVQRGMFIVNGAVDAAHRRRRLQSRISDAMFEEMVRRGCRFCFSTGNRLSTKPLLTRFKMLRTLEARIGFGVPRPAAEPVEPSFERLWSAEAMRWRLANPEVSYATRAEGGALSILADSGMPGIAATLYSGRNAWAVESGGEARGPLRLWLGADPNLRWSRSTFLHIPQALRPSPLHLVFRDLTGGGFLPDPKRLLFRGLDLDAY